MKTIYTLLCSLLIMTTSVLAEGEKKSDPYHGHEAAAWNQLDNAMQESMSVEAASKLKYIAYHKAARVLCDGVTTDTDKIATAVAELHPENWSEISDDERQSWTNTFLVHYGSAYGIMLAEHADNTDPFCKEVSELLADKEHAKDSYFVVEAN